jgi:hypothetical protein
MAAEWDDSTLRLKYGEPLARETFQVRPDLEMVVSYGSARQVCRMEISHPASHGHLDEVIDELVPPSMRGKRVFGPHLIMIGGYSVRSVHYEHVTVSEPYEPKHPDSRTGVTITFNRPDCQ